MTGSPAPKPTTDDADRVSRPAATVDPERQLEQERERRLATEELLRETRLRLSRLRSELKTRVAIRTTDLSDANQLLRREIEERARAEEALGRAEARVRKSRERLNFALDATAEGLWDWNIPTGEMYFSPRWCESLGFEQGELEPRAETREGLIHPEDWPRVKSALAAHLRGETAIYECENRLRRKDGHWRWNLDRGRVVERDADGAAVRMIGVDADITARKQADEARHRTERLAALGNLAAGLAHEINNPVGAILLTARTAIGFCRDPARADLTERCFSDIAEDAGRCGAILQGIVQFARRERSSAGPGSLRNALARSLELVRELAAERSAVLEVHAPAGLECDAGGDETSGADITVDFDVSELEEVLVRLLTNAIQSRSEGVRVVLSAELAECGVRLCVRDDGRGMSEADQERAFDPFFVGNHEGGAGLGLSVCHTLVQKHGGQISIESRPGTGTLVTVEVPMASGASTGQESR